MASAPPMQAPPPGPVGSGANPPAPPGQPGRPEGSGGSPAAQPMGGPQPPPGGGQGEDPFAPPPELQEMLKQPTWEEVLGLLKNDQLREYRVDIETNSTIDAEATQDKQDIAELLNAMSQWLNGLAPLVEKGVMPFDVVKTMLMAIARRYNFGAEIEDQLGKMQAPPPPSSEPSPEDQAKLQSIQAKAQADEAKSKADIQQTQMDMQLKEMEFKGKQALMQMEMQLKQEELALKQAELQLSKAQSANKLEQSQLMHQQKMSQLQQKGQVDAQLGIQKQALAQQGFEQKAEFAAAAAENKQSSLEAQRPGGK